MTEAIGTEERYLIASNTSNLRVVSESTGDCDVIIASGWAPNRIGSALMRLHTKPTRDNLYNVHMQVTIEAERLHIANPDAVASAVIAWWLDRLCKTCHGRKFDTIENTPSLSAIECPACRGTGLKPFPLMDDAAYKLSDWLDRCKHAHVRMIKTRIRPE